LLLIVLMSKNRSGFTLVELIVVIMVITTLLTLGITSYTTVQRNARNTERKTDLKDLQVALEGFRVENGLYPDTCNTAVTSCVFASSQWWSGLGCNWLPRAAWIPGLTPNYIERLPLDPRQNQVNSQRPISGCNTDSTLNCYIYRSNGFDYKLSAICTPEGTLNANDPFIDPARSTIGWAVYTQGGSAW